MTRHFLTVKKTALALAVLLAGVFCMETQAQFSEMLKDRTKKNRTEKSNIPTTVKSDAMDIDIGKNIITLLGNVEVDDPEMNIKCRKMMIFLENKAKEPETGEKAPLKDNPMDPAGGKQVSRIECVGDVVITRTSADEVAGSNVQKAFAGKAVYNVPTDTITLTENDPVVVSGPNRLAGEKIEVNIKTERITITGRATGQAEGGLLKK